MIARCCSQLTLCGRIDADVTQRVELPKPLIAAEQFDGKPGRESLVERDYSEYGMLITT